MANPKCPKCGTTLEASREEYEWYCPNRDRVWDTQLRESVRVGHYYRSMPRAYLNDLKRDALDYDDENAFATLDTKSKPKSGQRLPYKARKAKFQAPNSKQIPMT